jgi:hypothetical protein
MLMPGVMDGTYQHDASSACNMRMQNKQQWQLISAPAGAALNFPYRIVVRAPEPNLHDNLVAAEWRCVTIMTNMPS